MMMSRVMSGVSPTIGTVLLLMKTVMESSGKGIALHDTLPPPAPPVMPREAIVRRVGENIRLNKTVLILKFQFFINYRNI